MNPWYARAAVLAGTVAMVAIRAPHGQRSRKVAVAKSRRGALETTLLAICWLGFFVPLFWAIKPSALAVAEFELLPVPFVAGALCLAGGLWLLHRSHADLGRNWSITLEVREGHSLVTAGIYRRVRHPMYAGLLLYSVGQLLVLPNWAAGPTYLVAMGLLFAFRVGPEERMMREEFGAEYDAYCARTKRLLPGVW
jgi:protein-S-isoprenylcysteine O-methyltransferase Ste14